MPPGPGPRAFVLLALLCLAAVPATHASNGGAFQGSLKFRAWPYNFEWDQEGIPSCTFAASYYLAADVYTAQCAWNAPCTRNAVEVFINSNKAEMTATCGASVASCTTSPTANPCSASSPTTAGSQWFTCEVRRYTGWGSGGYEAYFMIPTLGDWSNDIGADVEGTCDFFD